MLMHCWYSGKHFDKKMREAMNPRNHVTIQTLPNQRYSTCNAENKEACEKEYIWDNREYLGQFENSEIKTIRL